MSEAHLSETPNLWNSTLPKEALDYFHVNVDGIGEQEMVALQPHSLYYDGINTVYVMLEDRPLRQEESVVYDDIILVDISDKDEVMGKGMVVRVKSNSPSLLDKPYVGWTETPDELKGHGLGIRRLKVMNQISLTHFGHVLNSDPVGHVSYRAQRSWQHLVRQGLAESYTDEGELRWRFIT